MMDLSEYQAELAEMRAEQDALEAEEHARAVREAAALALLNVARQIHERHRLAVLSAEAGLCSRMPGTLRRREAVVRKLSAYEKAGELLTEAIRLVVRL